MTQNLSLVIGLVADNLYFFVTVMLTIAFKIMKHSEILAFVVGFLSFVYNVFQRGRGVLKVLRFQHHSSLPVVEI